MSQSPVTNPTLTRFPPGSLKELAVISLPLMLSVLSGCLMQFVDRVMLARYSTEAMNGMAAAAMVLALFQFGAIATASIAEIFVGRHNGSGQTEKTGPACWQLIWFSLFTTLIFVPTGLFLGPTLVGHHLYGSQSLEYFHGLIFFGPLFPLFAALCAFFIGIGRVRLVMWTAVSMNLVNIGLDYLLIFGLDGVIPGFGITGAAIATGIGQIIGSVVLGFTFFRKLYRRTYGTRIWRLNLEQLMESLKYGVPGAIGHMIEIGAWALLLQLMGHASEIHFTVMVIGQGFFTLVGFLTEGLQKGVTSIASNILGSSKPDHIRLLLRSATLLMVLIALVLSIPLLFFPEPIVKLFLSKDLSPAVYQQVLSFSRISCVGVWLFCFFDGITWAIAGILTAGGDTRFVMGMNAVSTWLFAFLPMYFFVISSNGPAWLTWIVSALYAVMNALCFFLRYKWGEWDKLTAYQVQ